MRSVFAITEKRSKIALPASVSVIDFAVSDDASVTYVYGNDRVLYVADSLSGRVQANVDLELPAAATVVSMSFVTDLSGVVCASSTGELVLVHESTHRVEMVGVVDGGLCAMAWAPDNELVALVSCEGNLLLLTKNFEPLNEAPIADGVPVAAASISWRGDGLYFATSVKPRTGDPVPAAAAGPASPMAAQLRTWDRSCQPTCPVVPVAEACVAYQPSGALIAVPGASGGIALFERNGQSRGAIALAEAVTPTRLAWDVSSTLLAAAAGPHVLLLSVSNAHWYQRRLATPAAGLCDLAAAAATAAAQGPVPPSTLLSSRWSEC
jgi:hypothetical protein